MRIAWLRPALPATPDPLDDMAPLVAGLQDAHQIDLIDQRAAHDVVWRHARDPYDLFVHEIADAPEYQFVTPYAVHYPGVLALRGFPAHHPRAIQASRTVVVGDEELAASIASRFPNANVTHAPVGIDPGFGIGDDESGIRNEGPGITDAGSGIAVGLVESGRLAVVERAANRARDAGARLRLITGAPGRVIHEADVILALDWPPPAGPSVTALAAMAAGKPVVVIETLVTAGWPALDPQTWQPRGYIPAHLRTLAPWQPIAVSVDPRDEEHSLMLALRRLAADSALRASLGAAARAWWSEHATVAHAVGAWRRILEAPDLPPPPDFVGADHSEHARDVLAMFGVQVDFL
jgi:hypothetical protein